MNLPFACVKALFDLRRPEKKSEDTLLRAAVFSDTHITGALYRRALFIPAMRGAHKTGAELVIFAGDCTDNGNERNWRGFTETVLKYCRVKDRLVAIGNHDTWLSYREDHVFAPARENFLKNADAVTGRRHGEVYFTYEKNGVPFLVLGTEGTGVSETLSETQLDWLENTLPAVREAHPGMPVIVVNHHPMNNTHGVGNNAHGMGIAEGGERLQSLLDTAENVIYLCGHIHFGLQSGGPRATVQTVGKHITSVCLPCYEYGELFNGKYRSPGNPLIGAGLLMDISKQSVTLRGMNFLHGKAVASFVKEIPLE